MKWAPSLSPSPQLAAAIIHNKTYSRTNRYNQSKDYFLLLVQGREVAQQRETPVVVCSSNQVPGFPVWEYQAFDPTKVGKLVLSLHWNYKPLAVAKRKPLCGIEWGNHIVSAASPKGRMQQMDCLKAACSFPFFKIFMNFGCCVAYMSHKKSTLPPWKASELIL